MLYSFGNSVFMGCSSLQNIDLPSSIKALNGTFSGCASLERLIVPEGVMFIGNGTFSGCKKLSKLVLPSSITMIGKMAFSSCKLLECIDYNGDWISWQKIKLPANETLPCVNFAKP